MYFPKNVRLLTELRSLPWPEEGLKRSLNLLPQSVPEAYGFHFRSLQELKKTAVQNSEVPDTENPPVVPIYPVEEETPVAGVQQDFDAGDRVRHPKYGDGIVEKMVKFGNKVLCAISFANGRRLLDPTISQLEKI